MDRRADLLHGMVQTNPACANVTASNRTNATISSCPKMVSPAVCYDAAVKVCDFHAAAQASVRPHPTRPSAATCACAATFDVRGCVQLWWGPAALLMDFLICSVGLLLS